MSVWRASLFLGCLTYFLMEVEGYYGPTMVTLKNGTTAMAIRAKLSFNGELKFVCDKGYVYHPENSTLCLPVCERGCPYGFCNTPGECSCLGNFVAVSGECKPTCTSGSRLCGNGECVNGICANCYPGYKTAPSRQYCEPDCGKMCNSTLDICAFPNTCTCVQGYERRNNTCVPKCERNCLQGKCVAPNDCRCNAGAILKDGVCQARCWMDCTNGICVRENVCECLEGYSFALSSLKCMEKCVGCEHGKCIEFNQCQCNEGYEWSTSEGRCKPKCNNCYDLNMHCAAPNVCECDKGYLADTTSPRLICAKQKGRKVVLHLLNLRG